MYKETIFKPRVSTKLLATTWELEDAAPNPGENVAAGGGGDDDDPYIVDGNRGSRRYGGSSSGSGNRGRLSGGGGSSGVGGSMSGRGGNERRGSLSARAEDVTRKRVLLPRAVKKPTKIIKRNWRQKPTSLEAK